MVTWKALGAIVLLAFGMGMLAHAHFFKPDPVEVVTIETKVVRDTLVQDVPKIEYVYVPELVMPDISVPIDTPMTTAPVYDESDLDYAYAGAVATLDTSLADHGHLKVDYTLPPINRFDLLFEPAPPLKVIETRWLKPRKPPWWRSGRAQFVYGALFTGTLVYLVK